MEVAASFVVVLTQDCKTTASASPVSKGLYSPWSRGPKCLEREAGGRAGGKEDQPVIPAGLYRAGKSRPGVNRITNYRSLAGSFAPVLFRREDRPDTYGNQARIIFILFRSKARPLGRRQETGSGADGKGVG